MNRMTKANTLRETVAETIKVLARDANRRGERHVLAFLLEHLDTTCGKRDQAFRTELAHEVKHF